MLFFQINKYNRKSLPSHFANIRLVNYENICYFMK